MIQHKHFFLTILLLVFSFSIAFGGTNKVSEERKAKIETNLLVGLNSENEGLKINSAYLLGEIESSKAVIPLMKMLRDDENESVRLVAALSLVKIGDARGLYLVKKSAKFNSAERVRKMCERFYAAYLKGNIDDQYKSNNAFVVLSSK